MPRGDRHNWGGARQPKRADAKPRGPKPTGVRAELGKERMAELRALADAASVEPEVLAARWLADRLAAEWAAYQRERGLSPTEPAPAEWGGEIL